MRAHVLILSSLLLFCSAAVADPSVRVGVILPLTGGAADYGESVRNSIELAREDRKDVLSKVDFLYEDAAYDPKQAVSAFHKLTRVDKVDLIYVWGVAYCKAVAPLAEASRVPFIGQCIDPTIARDRSYVIRFMNYTDQYLLATTRYLHSKGHLRLAVVVTENPYLEEMLAALERNLLDGQTVSVIDRLPPSEMDFRSVISRIRRSNADAVGVFLSIGQIAAFYRQLREQQLTLSTFGTNFFESLTEIQAAGGALDGAIFANNEVGQSFVRRYKERFGRITQIGFGALAYEFVSSLGTVIESLPPAQISGNAILKGFAQLPKQAGTAAGPYEFRSDPIVGRYFEFPIVIKQIRGSDFSVVDGLTGSSLPLSPRSADAPVR